MYIPPNSQAKLDRFLVCGLGSMGQHCVAALKEFGVSVSAIDEVPPKNWEIPNLLDLLDDLLIGDCRLPSVLQRAKIEQCRAVLIVTRDERVNIETALEARQLNPYTRLVVRSAQENLNQLLAEHFGNFIAFEPTQLPAATFVLAALGTETRGFFNLEGQWLRVVKRQIQASDRWCDVRLLHEINNRKRLVLCHTPNSAQPSPSFHEWEPDARVQAGDTIVYIESTDPSATFSEKSVKDSKQNRGNNSVGLRRLNWRNLKQKLSEFWRSADENKLKKVALICGITVLCLWLLGTFFYQLTYPNISLADAFLTSAMLLLGGFGDLFGGFNFTLPVPLWLRFISLGMAIAGTAFVGILYGFLTERILASRFQLIKRRPPVPEQDHVVVIGLGRVGRGIATLLQEFKQPLVGIAFDRDFDMTSLPDMPLIVGNLKETLAKANIATAKSIIVDTDNEMLNLEVGLMARAANPNSNLVIRTLERRLTDNLSHLLPNASVFSAYALAAEAFAGAAFGENILSLFRLNKQTVLVTEYTIQASDTLNELLLAEIAYGYGVVPIVYQKPTQPPMLMPSEDMRLAVGDRLVILATIDGLRRIEQGRLSITPKGWRIQVEKAVSPYGLFEGANAIARISGCDLNTARDLMKNLPGTLQTPLYKHQAQRLVRELSKIQVAARIVPIISNNTSTQNTASFKP